MADCADLLETLKKYRDLSSLLYLIILLLSVLRLGEMFKNAARGCSNVDFKYSSLITFASNRAK